jgi:hypothetical protein
MMRLLYITRRDAINALTERNEDFDPFVISVTTQEKRRRNLRDVTEASRFFTSHLQVILRLPVCDAPKKKRLAEILRYFAHLLCMKWTHGRFPFSLIVSAQKKKVLAASIARE